MLREEHAACGVGLRVSLSKKASRQTVIDGITDLQKMAYRAAENEVTGESDGVGIKLYGLPVEFFNKKIKEGEFSTIESQALINHQLIAKQFIIGQYFLSQDPIEQATAKKLIAQSAQANDLQVVAWRDLNHSKAVDVSILSKKTLEKKPSMWQAILSPAKATPDLAFDLETAALKTTGLINYKAREQKLSLNVISQSNEAIIYKGMLRAEEIEIFYKDLIDPDFTATASLVHSRFATNTDPQWANAQPCEHWAHNGEQNSVSTNAADMRSELSAREFYGTYPNAKLSDSAQVSADLANQMIMKDISLMEAFVRLLPPFPSENYSPEVNAMLRCFQLERRPYNGPAFGIAGSKDYYIAKLDVAALRPSRWTIIEKANGERQFIAASDDFIIKVPGEKIIAKGHLEGGSMMVVTPEGQILQTPKVLTTLSQQYHEKFKNEHYFQDLLAQTLTEPLTTKPDAVTKTITQLNRILYDAGWDQESAEVVRYMSIHGLEKVGAMGDDTNPLYMEGTPGHISYFFHQLFAQVSAPPQDSTHEPENFSLKTTLGPMLYELAYDKQIPLESPILAEGNIFAMQDQQEVPLTVLDTGFDSTQMPLSVAITQLLLKAELAAQNGGIIILKEVSSQQTLIPDVIAIAAVRRYLEHKNLSRRVSIVVDSYQIAGPHHVAVLLSLGAQAVYPRGAYAKIRSQNEGNNENYRHALEKCLLKTMGKMGIHDVNAYINGSFVGALGIDLTDDPSLAKIFSGIYSPLKGINLYHIAEGLTLRHQQAYDENIDFARLPHSGYYMPEKNGIKHGYGPNVIAAFTQWLKAEDLRAQLKRMHNILEKKGEKNYVDDSFSLQTGFLDTSKKDKSGFYHPKDLENFKSSIAFNQMMKEIDNYRKIYPTSLRDCFDIIIDSKNSAKENNTVQSQQEIRSRLFAGSMSQGALTVSDPNTPERLGAHEALTRGMNAIGAKSASGEGGEAPKDLLDPLKSTRSKQLASGRFGVSAMQICSAADSEGEIEIKVAQGAKPGEGGQLPGLKVSVRFASQRHVLPGTPCISPPPHHDIYSIEDLTQLIESIKAVKPNVKVAVKLVASPGIGTIAVGVAKAGADVINIAGNSGGTGAAQLSSIKHTGYPAELGLVLVDKALRQTGQRDLVQLRTSGGFKTPEDVIIAAILGADLFEFGTTAMLTLGCKMQRTCNQSCQPGVAADGHLFKGDQINVERFFVNIAAAVQARLQALGVNSLEELKGRTDLLALHDKEMEKRYDFSAFLKPEQFQDIATRKIIEAVKQKRKARIADPLEINLITEIKQFFDKNPNGTFNLKNIELTTLNRSFGARIAGEFAKYFEQFPQAKIILNTHGSAGQSMGFVLPQGLEIHHEGSVQDGVAKSMTGGEMVLKTPFYHEHYEADKNTIAGNAIAYGASGGKLFIEGRVGHRLGILCKGAEIVVEGTGDLAFEYMTDGTGMILGNTGKGLCSSAVGGIVFAYDDTNSVKPSEAVRIATEVESSAYEQAIKDMLKEHVEKTQSKKGQEILKNFELKNFKVCIPKGLDQIKTQQQVIDIVKMYHMRKSPISRGMHIWLTKKIEEYGTNFELIDLLNTMPEFKSVVSQLPLIKTSGSELALETTDSSPVTHANSGLVHIYPKNSRNVTERLNSIHGLLDESLWDALTHIQTYANTLSHDAQGCSGCLAQGCAGGDDVQTGCPSGKQINTINAILQRLGTITKGQMLTIKQWETLREAFFVQTQESPFISYTGAACTAPCQDACTETISDKGEPNPKRDYKLVGEHVHIKDIEFFLFQVGRAMGWFDGKKLFSKDEIIHLFGHQNNVESYNQVIARFSPLFIPAKTMISNKELVIVGSGPAAMQIAYQALKDGIKVRMYEKSDKPGGLLVDGIPAHKFDKSYLGEDFAYLKAMGLELHLNSEVCFNQGQYYVKGEVKNPIADARNDNQHIAICVGAGKAREFEAAVTQDLLPKDKKKIIQAVDFLKVANDVADILQKNPNLSEEDRQTLIRDRFKDMDPRGKKIVVVGGGDTAQDVIRWVARYFNPHKDNEELNILVRGPQIKQRGIHDSYPAQSLAPSKENILQAQEVKYVNGNRFYLVEPQKIQVSEDGKLTIHLNETKFKAVQIIESDKELKEMFEQLPRKAKPVDKVSQTQTLESVDLVICALGFEGADTCTLVKEVKNAQTQNVSFAGDATGVEAQIIVGAQASGAKTYVGQIAPALGIKHQDKPQVNTSKMLLKSWSLNKKNVVEEKSSIPVQTTVFKW